MSKTGNIQIQKKISQLIIRNSKTFILFQILTLNQKYFICQSEAPFNFTEATYLSKATQSDIFLLCGNKPHVTDRNNH